MDFSNPATIHQYLLPDFLNQLGIDTEEMDKLTPLDVSMSHVYRDTWVKTIGWIPGVLLYALTRMSPYAAQCRKGGTGWVDPFQWTLDNHPYHRTTIHDLLAKHGITE